MRILSDEVVKHVGKRITIKGWIHKKRLLGGLTFINVRDRRGLVQVVVEDKEETEKLRGLQIGTVVAVEGKAVKEARAPGGAELHEPVITVEVAVTDEPSIEIDKPIQHKSENLDTLFENRVLNIRNLQEQKIFKIRSSVTKHARQFLADNEFVEIDTPKLLAGATEGGAEVFELDYFGKATATLAQSPQLYKQMLVGAFERVYEIGHSYRAEPSATTRHLSELTMLDIEMGFVESHDEVLNMVADLVHHVLRNIYKEHEQDLKSLNAPELKIATDGTVPRFTIAEIHEMYSKALNTDTTNEKDLIPDEERWICQYVTKKYGTELVYAIDFPKEAGKFYHKFKENTVVWGDLLFRGVEIATVPMRENDYQTMLKQMQKAGIDTNHEGFKYYLQAFKYGLPSHGGCGMGIDRLVQKTIGLKNVKEATLFPRDINRLTP